MIFLPPLLVAVIGMIFGLILLGHKVIKSLRNSPRGQEALFSLTRAIIVSLICIIFLFHPTFTLKSLAMFLCQKVDEGDYRMLHNLEYQCWSWDHIKWILALSFPIIMIYVIGFPLIGLYFLVKNRRNLETRFMQVYFLILHQGYKPQTFYWEYINELRKLSIILVNSLLSIFSVNYKILCSMGKF